MARTLGIEEELLLVDPATRQVTGRSPQVIKQFREHGRGRRPRTATDEVDAELFRHQLETRTDPTTDLADARAQVVRARRTAGEAAEMAGLATAACGIVPLGGAEVVVSPNDRYRDMVETFGEVARTGGTCGMHVHVGIESAEEGVGVIDRIVPWLPILLALSANSPFCDDRDTGYASWRSQVWARWPSAGPTQRFGSVEGYRAVGAAMKAVGAARDDGMLYHDARLSRDHPTVEVRVADVCTDPDDGVLVAGLVRALVETAAAEWRAEVEPPAWRPELLRATQWRASRFGVTNRLADPETLELTPAREVLAGLVDRVRPALEEAGDLAVVEAGIARVLAGGGATRQRAAYERTGSVEGVVDDLVARTRESWSADGESL